MTLWRRFMGSMAGRLFVILLVGTAAASLISLSLADMRHRAQLWDFHLERVADRVESVAGRLQGGGPDAAEASDRGLAGGAALVAPDGPRGKPDPALTARLNQRSLDPWRAAAYAAPPATCDIGRPGPPPGRAGARRRVTDSQAARLGLERRNCWVVDLAAPDGTVTSMAVGAPPRPARPRIFSVWLLAGLIITGTALSLFVATIASRPLRRLSRAAEALRDDLNAPPTPVTGPREVAQAALALNSLQARLHAALEEKSQILAAVTHDLQTPLTRLRLRVEKVNDPDLKERLLGDLASTQSLIQEGMELARNRPSEEPFVALSLDSLLTSMADDEADAGRPVTFGEGCACDVYVRPRALRRCLANLIDNAVIHGGGAEISAHAGEHEVCIEIRDNGPGIDPKDIERVVEPFVRLETSRSRDTGGTGLGLTIAARLARETQARLELEPRQDRGLLVRLHVRRAVLSATERKR
jgi:signal transduction histidine kinase